MNYNFLKDKMFSFSKYEEFFDVFPKLKNLAHTKQDLFFMVKVMFGHIQKWFVMSW